MDPWIVQPPAQAEGGHRTPAETESSNIINSLAYSNDLGRAQRDPGPLPHGDIAPFPIDPSRVPREPTGLGITTTRNSD